jgi:hypothetical protein
MHLAQIDDQYWATFDARAIAPAPNGASAPAAEAQPEASSGGQQGALAAAAAEQESAGSGAGEQAAAGGPDQTGQAGNTEEVALDQPAGQEPAQPLDPDQLNQRLGKWAYRIPEQLYNRLSTARSELVHAQGNTS